MLADFDALAGLEEVGQLAFNNLHGPGPIDLSMLSSLTTASLLRFYGIDSLVTLDGLGNVQVSGDVIVQSNDLLEDVNGLSSISSIGGVLRITNNASLCQTHAEAIAASISVSGGTLIGQNYGSCP